MPRGQHAPPRKGKPGAQEDRAPNSDIQIAVLWVLVHVHGNAKPPPMSADSETASFAAACPGCFIAPFAGQGGFMTRSPTVARDPVPA